MSKSFDKKDVFSWANCEDAKEYIGKKGYFGGDLDELTKQINENKLYTLNGVNLNNATLCFVTHSFVGKWSCSLFLPEDKVKKVEEEKQYRPFKNLNELKECISKDTLTCLDHGIEIIDTSKGSQYRLMILGTSANGVILPLYGELTMEQLFERFKININGNWQPFGIEE